LADSKSFGSDFGRNVKIMQKDEKWGGEETALEPSRLGLGGFYYTKKKTVNLCHETTKSAFVLQSGRGGIECGSNPCVGGKGENNIIICCSRKIKRKETYKEFYLDGGVQLEIRNQQQRRR